MRHKDLGAALGKRKRWWRSRWVLAGVTLFVILAAVAAISSQQASAPSEAPVAEGPPPVISASGPVVPERRARMSFTVGGRVSDLTVRPGDQVKQGQVLARLDPASVQTTGVGVASIGGSDLYILAPFDGVVGLVPVNEWESVTPGTPVVIIGDMSMLRVEIEDLSESDVGRLEVGQPVEVTFEAFPGKKTAGRVTRISPMNNAKGGGVNYDVVVEFEGADLPPLRWGMTAHADIRVDGSR